MSEEYPLEALEGPDTRAVLSRALSSRAFPRLRLPLRLPVVDVWTDLLHAQLTIAGHTIAWREVVGNAFGLASAVVVGIITAAVWFLLGFFLGKGKNWARIVATVLGVLNVVLFLVGLLGLGMMPGAAVGGGITLVLNAVSAALAAAIVFLIWKKESTAYFKGTR